MEREAVKRINTSSSDFNIWLHNIKYNYDHDIDTDITMQLLDMSKDLDLGLTFDDIDRGCQKWYPRGNGETISIEELKTILEDAGYNEQEDKEIDTINRKFLGGIKWKEKKELD